MKICTRCGQVAQDNEAFCNRCGGTKFTQQAAQKPQQPRRPQPQQQQMQRAPQQNQQQMTNTARPQRPNMPNMQNQPGQQGMQNQNMNNMQNQQVAQNQNMNSMEQGAVNTKKPGIFQSRKDKKAQMEQEMAMMKQMQQARNQGQQIPNQQVQNNNYAQPNINMGYQQNQSNFIELDMEMSVKDWVITLLMLVVPIWNIVYIVKNMNNPSIPLYKQNFLKAYALYFIGAFVVSIVLTLILYAVGIMAML